MKAAALPPDEEQRLRALRETKLLDSLPEPAWDDLARLASAICGTPVALVSLIDADRQWFKARVGLALQETSREVAFCAHAILQHDVFEVNDAGADGRFADNPLVTGELNIRFYAGAPILTDQGDALGTVCAIDRTPRQLSAEQRAALLSLARQAGRLTSLARSRDELANWTALIESTLEATADGICCIDREARVITSNRRFAEIFGFSAEEVRRGAPNPMMTRGVERLRDPDAYRALVAEQDRSPSHDRFDVVELADGRTVERYSRPQLRDGAVIGRVNSFRDITERRAVERMKDEFVATVSHELRTPLTAIRGALGLIEGGVAGEVPKAAAEFIALARDNADRLIRLVNGILDLERLRTGQLLLQPRALDAAEVAAGVIAQLQPVAEAIALQLECAGPLPLAADRDRLAQVLTNLVANAIKFSPPGGRVIVRGRAVGERVRFEIADQGPGIEPAQQQRLFRRFEQLDPADRRSRGGTGLGLAISKAIVEQHGGSIGVQSEPGRGSTFWFELPRGSRTP